MRVYRYKNGDVCPCCGQVLSGKSPEQLADFSLTIYGFATALGLADWIMRPGDDAIEISPDQAYKIVGLMEA